MAQRFVTAMVAKNLTAGYRYRLRRCFATADGLLELGAVTPDAQVMHLALEAIWLMLGDANTRVYFRWQAWGTGCKSESEADQLRHHVTSPARNPVALLIRPVPESAGKFWTQPGPQTSGSFAAVGVRLTTAPPPPTLRVFRTSRKSEGSERTAAPEKATLRSVGRTGASRDVERGDG